MADANITGKTYIGMNVEGDRREDMIEFLSASGGTAADVVTRLAHVESATCVHQAATGAVTDMYLNTNDTTENKAGYGGQIHFAAMADAVVFKLTAKGW